MKFRPAIVLTASSMLAAVACLAPLSTSAQTSATNNAQSTTTVPGAVMSTNGNTTTVTGTTGTTATGATGTTGVGTTGAGTTATTPSTTTVTPTGVSGAITGARDAFVLTCVFDIRTTPVSFVVFEASGTVTPAPQIAIGSPCSQALGTLLSSGFALANSLPAFEGATQYTFVR